MVKRQPKAMTRQEKLSLREEVLVRRHLKRVQNCWPLFRKKIMSITTYKYVAQLW